MDNNGFSLPNNCKKGLSAAEFQRNLYNWFEGRGLLDDLRAQLRHQMVVALRNTSLGPDSSKHSKKVFSPKIQAINLLIAEFLLQHEHHYTLSIFTSEVPLLRTMPEFTLSGTQITGESSATSGESAPRFHHDDVKDILESFGLPIESDIGSRIYAQYQDNEEGAALLTCILQNVSERKINKSGNSTAHNENEAPVKDSHSRTNLKDAKNSEKESRSIKKLKELYKAEMQEIIYQSQLKSQHIKQLQEEIRRFQESEVEKVRKEEEAKFQKELTEREARIQADMHNREEEISQKLKEAENKIAKQRQTLDTEVKKKRQELSALAAQLQEQHLQMNCKMRQMEEQAEHLECEERRVEEMKQKDSLELAERTSVLDMRQQQLQQEFERLNAERETMSFVQLQLEESRRQLIEATQSLAHSQSEVSFLRNDVQQQCAHLRYELDATRLKLDNLTEMQLQKPSEALAPVSQVQRMEMTDKELQTVSQQFPETRGTAAQTSPEPENITQDKCIDMEIVQSQQMQQQLQYLRDVLRQVQRENEELRGHTQQQRLRIDELTSHAANLANQLEDAHTTITFFSNRPAPEPGPSEPRLLQPMFLSPGPGTITVPPLIAPPPPPLPPPLPPQSPPHSRQVGAGEELNYVTPLPTLQQPPLPSTSFSLSSGFSNISHRREWRKKPPRRLMVHSNSNSSEETSPTEEILQEARRRLRKLEEESEAVDRSYQNFRRRQESLVPTTSLLFHSVLPPHLHYHSSSFGYGNFTSSQPLYSSATGGNNMPVFSNLNYDSRPSPRRNDVLFTPLISNTTSRIFPSMYQNERIPSAVPFTVGSDMQYRSTDNILGRITSQPRYPGLNNTLHSQSRVMTNPTESRFSFPPQPSTSTGLPRNTDSPRSRLEKNNSSTQIHNFNNYNLAFSESHNHHHHQTKAVTFGSPLKTTMVYTSPQVSSTESLARQPDNVSALITVQSDISGRPVTSTVQSSPRNENVIREINRTPQFASKLQGSAASSLQHFPGSDMPDDQQTSLTHRLSTDNIWQIRYKLSSYFNPSVENEIPIKCSTSVEKDVTPPSNDSEIKKIFVTTSDTSKSHTTLSEDLHPSGSFVLSETTEGGSTEYGIHPVCDVSGNTFSSSIKDSSLGRRSTGEESLIQSGDVNGKEVGILTTHDEAVLSEISGSVTQTTVKHKEGGTSESNVSLARSSEHKLNQNEMIENSPGVSDCKTSEERNIFKQPQNIKYSLPSTSKDTGNETHDAESSKVNEVPVLIQEKTNVSLDKNRINTSETYEAVADLENPMDTDPEIALRSETDQAVVDLENSTDANAKIVVISKTEEFKSESLTEEESENAISTGDQSKKDESSKDDFW